MLSLSAKRDSAKADVKTKNLGDGSFRYGGRRDLRRRSEAVVKFLRADGMLEKETHDLQLYPKLRRAYAKGSLFPQC